ncbi:MAG: winged helix-turn-helix domain-containing protein [Candidatus Micrarchaeota archaeon]
MLDLFLRKKPCKMLVLLKDSQEPKYISEIAKESGATYVHATKLIKKLEKSGVVVLEKVGKKRMVRLTDDGLKIATALSEAMVRLNSQQAVQPPALPK